MKGKFSTLALMACVVIACAGFGGCASLQSQHQKIAAACETVASAGDAIAAANTAGRVTASQAADALRIYRATIPFCQPQPVESLSAVDYAALLSASVQLTAISESAR